MSADDYILAALQRERDGYLAYGRDDRAAEVEKQIKLHKGTAPVKPREATDSGQVTREAPAKRAPAKRAPR